MLKPNRLLISCAANFSSVREVADAYTFFSSELVIYGPGNNDDWMNYFLYQMNNNSGTRAAVLTFLSELGTGIRDVLVSIDQKMLDSVELPPFLSEEFKRLLLQNSVDAISVKVRYDGFETNLLREESTGIKKLFAILCPFVDIMVNGRGLVCDELESSLHESLVYGLVKPFVNTDAGFAQLIFTTHETGLLNLDLFRRDQIWFTELTRDGRATDLYSLSEIKNIRKDENFGRGYITGKYGAIPMLNLDFANIVSHL